MFGRDNRGLVHIAKVRVANPGGASHAAGAPGTEEFDGRPDPTGSDLQATKPPRRVL